ncbi:MAG TPA: ABC transporter permease [Vicinamibacterales bacterium]|nr:ABC transporter permease [Vicinamibacterales bacterium]
MPRLPRWFVFPSRSQADIEADVREEIEFHLDMRARKLMDRGWPADRARAEALRQFGDPDSTAHYCRRFDAERERDMRLRRLAEELRQDMMHAARMLRRAPGLSATLLLTIALGIGAATLVFSVVHAALLAPLPYAQADRLAVVRLSVPDYRDLQESVQAFEQTGVWASNLYMLDDEQVQGGVVTPGFFTTLGVASQLGRVILESDASAPVVVLSHGLWQRRFGGDPQIVGKSLRLLDEAHTIVGVMPPAFRFPSSTFQLWVNMNAAMAARPEQLQNRALRIFTAVGRLRSDVDLTRAQAELSALSSRLQQDYPDTNEDVQLTATPLRERMVGEARPSLLVALGAVGGLLLIACVNVANLMLARLTTRTHELAIRVAIGAGRWRLARQLMTESLLVSVCGGALGVLLAWWGATALPHAAAGRIPFVEDAGVNLPVLVTAFLAILVVGLLVGLAPVAHLTASEIEPALKGGGRGDGSVTGAGRLRSALVVAQIAIAVVVLSGGLVLTRSLLRLLDADTGFAAERVLAFNLVLVVAQPDASGRAALAERALEAVSTLPGVEAAGGATGLAPITAQRGTAFEVDGAPGAPVDQRRAYFIAATPGYFETLQVRVLAGRTFAPDDRERTAPVAVISRTLARRFFADERSAIGRRLRLVNPDYSRDWRTIVGVVDDVRYQGLDNVDPPVLYTPFAQTPFLWIYMHARTMRDPRAALGAIRDALQRVDTRLVPANPQPMTALVSESSADPRFRTTLISTFAAVALALAAVGLHGLVSFGVARSAREIAIRLALGASARSIRWRVLRGSLMLAGLGSLLGLAGAFWTGRLLTTMLYETTPTDPLALTVAAGSLLIVALLASAAPARRAIRIDPVEALRDA